MTEDIRDIIPPLPKPQTPKSDSTAKKESPEKLLTINYSLDQDGQSKIRHSHVGMPHKDAVEMSNCTICRHLLRSFEKFTSGVRPRMLSLASSLRRSANG